ncbi:type IV pilin protein [Psychrobacter alimentarius]|uniref:type IV pilin protein n=1 Tax=Psychrobacter alimentarius TaxID=261164 RepID=UPI001919ACE1
MFGFFITLQAILDQNGDFLISNKGFTIIELMLVITIIGVLVSIAINKPIKLLQVLPI